MNKIFFNDRYGLTQAVFDGRKTMTRRMDFTLEDQQDLQMLTSSGSCTPYVLLGKVYTVSDIGVTFCRKTRYQFGEVLAVAQSYWDAGVSPDFVVSYKKDGTPITAIQSPGWTNKMFTRADMPMWENGVFTRVDLMPYIVIITGVHVERLQDISDEDCLREGVRYLPEIGKYYFERVDKEQGFYFNSPREAFAALIDKVSGKGTWDSNPFVVVYKFELVK